MNQSFSHTILVHGGIAGHRIGLSATCRPGKGVIYKALDEGINYSFTGAFTHEAI